VTWAQMQELPGENALCRSVLVLERGTSAAIESALQAAALDERLIAAVHEASRLAEDAIAWAMLLFAPSSLRQGAGRG
jgi:hypothetical protein